MHAKLGSLSFSRRFFCSALFALSVSSCGHQPSAPPGPSVASQNPPQLSDRNPALPALVEAAVAGEVTSPAQLRLLGTQGLNALLAAYDATPAENLERRARLSLAIDAVAKQKDARASRLYWHTDLELAKQEALAAGKPILSP